MSVTTRIKKLEQKIGGECFAVIAKEDWVTESGTDVRKLLALSFTVNGQTQDIRLEDGETESLLRQRAWQRAKDANSGRPVFLLSPAVKKL